MRKSIKSIFPVFILLPVLAIGCAFASSLVQPSQRNTQPSEPTFSDKFEFSDVTLLDQESKDTINISFGYQIEKDLATSGLQIMAQPQRKDVSCSINDFTTNSKPYVLEDAPDLVKSDNVTTMSMTTPAKCRFNGFTLMVFRLEGSNPVILYEQDFDIPFDLEKQ